MDEPTQRAVTQREFARQSPNFERAGSLFRDDAILSWIAEHVPVPPNAQVLDVAGGTGRAGRYLAREGGSVVVVDVTDEMLQAGLRSVEQDGRHDVTFVRGDATDLPFPDAHFDVVVCRFALHHMTHPAAAVDEMARVCRATGTITIVDLVAGGARHDELERLRDPSHTRALPEQELHGIVARAATRPAALRSDAREHTMLVAPWLEQSHTARHDRERILKLLAAEADGRQPTGLRAARDPAGQLTITQRWALVGT